MKTTVNFNDFVDGFQKIGRGNQFSFNALELLYNYLESVEKETGTEMEFDPIAICCSFSEYTVSDFNNDFRTKFETLDQIGKYISDYTEIIGKTKNSIVFENY